MLRRIRMHFASFCIVLWESKLKLKTGFYWISGRAGADYPILGAVPYTNFYCDEQKYPGFFADTETRCQGYFLFNFCVFLLSMFENKQKKIA